DDPGIVGVATRADEAPVAEGGPQPLAAGVDQPAQRLERGHEVGVDRTPALDLAGQQLLEPAVDARREEAEARGGGGWTEHLHAHVTGRGAGRAHRAPGGGAHAAVSPPGRRGPGRGGPASRRRSAGARAARPTRRRRAPRRPGRPPRRPAARPARRRPTGRWTGRRRWRRPPRTWRRPRRSTGRRTTRG